MMHIKINVINYIIIIFINVCVNITTKNLIHYMKYFVKFNANILNVTRNVKNLHIVRLKLFIIVLTS